LVNLYRNLVEIFNGSKNATLLRNAPEPVKTSLALCHRLLTERGEFSGRFIAAEILRLYRSLDASGRDVFFCGLLNGFAPDPKSILQAGKAYQETSSPENLALLVQAVEAPRRELFQRLNVAANGTRTLVGMRGELLRCLPGHPTLAAVEADLSHLFTSWFNRGFLVLQRIDWRTSASILEKIIQYEAVHQIQSWQDLRRRLEADRRCYAFFHPALPDEPIIFVEAALTRGMSSSVQPLLDPDAPASDPLSADCAMFYSITNCQDGLRGVPFGSFLLKRVVEDLGMDLPRLRRFATLSPIPGFREWLDGPAAEASQIVGHSKLKSLIQTLQQLEWHKDANQCAQVRPLLVSLAAYFLLHVKHGKEPSDPVARFHLGNGARLQRINWLGDTSAAGLQRSAGLMVNYVYRLADLEQNHESYTRYSRIAASRGIQKQAHIALV
jgi:malonyl-CoA decarboxylase